MAPCPNCGNARCENCRDYKGRCASCAEYDLPEWLKVKNESDKCDLVFECLTFHGLGVHWYVWLKETYEARAIPVEGEEGTYESRPSEFEKRTKFNTKAGVHGWFVIQARKFKEQSGKDEVTVCFDEGEYRTWFYKEGD